jgi:hypothetical protein
MMQDNTRNMLQFMNTMFSIYSPDIFVETVLWVFSAYRNHGFKTTYWPAYLDVMKQINKEVLDPAANKEIEPYFNWLIVNIPLFIKVSDDEMDALSKKAEPKH